MAIDILPVQALAESPISPTSTLGPYRRVDYGRLPDEPRCELIYGRFYLSPSPRPLHQIVAQLLWRRLDDIAVRIGGIAFMAPLDTILADHTVVQPDLLYISPQRISIVGKGIEGAPDLVVEVLSPGTARRDRSEKLRAYAELGVREYWMADWAEHQIEFLVNRDGQFQVALPLDGIYRSAVLPEIELDLADFWQAVESRIPPTARPDQS
ncbi:MAG TPA: Uma2 family endonuclease [Thermoanaerobaculia bacterium]|jgi:Uma2 family endonuclease|nr:Uma2 family endonuclease [Thermoanaerobaculia bacterium]